ISRFAFRSAPPCILHRFRSSQRCSEGPVWGLRVRSVSTILFPAVIGFQFRLLRYPRRFAVPTGRKARTPVAARATRVSERRKREVPAAAGAAGLEPCPNPPLG